MGRGSVAPSEEEGSRRGSQSLGNYKPRSSRRQIQRRARGSDEEEPTPKRKRAEGEEGKEGKERRHPPSEATPRPPAGAGKAGALGQRGTPEPRRGRADGGAGPLRALSPNRVGAAPKSNTSAVRAALSGALGPPMVSPSLASALASALGGGRGVGGMGEDAGPTIESILTSPLKAGSAPPLVSDRHRPLRVLPHRLVSTLEPPSPHLTPPLAPSPQFTPSVLGPLGTHTNENTPSKFLNPSGLSPLRTRECRPCRRRGALPLPALPPPSADPRSPVPSADGGAEVGAMNAQGAAGAATPTVRTRSHRTAGPSAPSSLRLGTRGLRSALGQGLDSAPDSAQRGEGLGGDRLGVGEGALPWRLSPTVGFSSPPLGGAGGGDGGGELVGMGMGALGLGLGMGMGIEGLSAGMTPICGAMPSPGFLGLETPDLFQARSARRRPSDPAARGGAGPPGEGSTPLRVRGGAGEGLATGGRGAAGRRGSAVRTPVDEGAAGARSPGAGLGTGQTGVTLEHLPGVRGRSSMGTIQKPKTPSERVPAPR